MSKIKFLDDDAQRWPIDESVDEVEWLKTNVLHSIPIPLVPLHGPISDYTEIRVWEQGRPATLRIKKRLYNKIVWSMSRQSYYGLYDTFRDRLLLACGHEETEWKEAILE